MTKQYKLEDLRKCYKQFEGHTFNHFMMGVVSKSLYQWFEQNGTTDVGSSLLATVPAVMKSFTSQLKHLDIDNYTAGATYQFSLRKDLKQAIKDTTDGFKGFYTFSNLIYIIILLNIFAIVPSLIGKFAYRHF